MSLFGTGVEAQTQVASPQTFNSYILAAVEMLARTRANGGYNKSRNFTQDLSYGGGIVRATRPLLKDPGPNPSMCVAAVGEIIIESINLYDRDSAGSQGYQSVYQKLPIGMWNGHTRLSLRPYIWRYMEVYSPGTAYALETFGLGRQKKEFAELLPGDVVNLNRSSGTGHSVIFMNFINARRSDVSYGDSVVGFRYFSAQGQDRPDGGFGFRYAFFNEKVPRPRERDDDAFIMPSSPNPVMLNFGEMFHPNVWRVQQAIANLRSTVTRSLEEQAGTSGFDAGAFVPQELERHLTEDPAVYVDGSGDET